MIIDLEGNKTTPKCKAQDRIMDALARELGYWREEGQGDMTDREADQVQDQMKKLADRIAKQYGFEEAWAA